MEEESVLERLVAQGLVELPKNPKRDLPEPMFVPGGVSDLIAAQRR